jgi:CheY-like chemotaxis protein
VSDQSVILLVEDREDDILLVRKAFERGCISNPVKVVRDGEEAIHYLAGEGRYSNREEYPLPELILLDLKLPKVDGFELVKWIRRQPGFGTIPIVVLTSSDAIRDMNRAYALGANSFLVKPLDFENFVETAKTLRTYWLKASSRPEAHRPTEKNLSEQQVNLPASARPHQEFPSLNSNAQASET